MSKIQPVSCYCSHGNDWTVCLISLVKKRTKLYCSNKAFNKRFLLLSLWDSHTHTFSLSFYATRQGYAVLFNTIGPLFVGKFHTSNVIHVLSLLRGTDNLFRCLICSFSLWAIWTTADTSHILWVCSLVVGSQKPWRSLFFPISYDQHTKWVS